MNKIKTAVTAAMALVGMAGTALAAEGTLHIYNWTEYTDPAVIEKFEKETGIKVVVDTYDSNETLLAKLQSGATGYDIVIPTQHFVEILINENLLQQVDVKGQENYKNVENRWQNPPWDRQQQYSAPWHWGTASFSYRSDLYSGKGESLKEFFDPEDENLKGRVMAFASPDEIVNLAHLYLGSDFCSEDNGQMKAVYELLAKQKPFVLNYNSEIMNDSLATGEAIMANHWNGFSWVGRTTTNENITYAYPKEGVVGWFDSMVVPKGASNVDAALAFMNFMMDPENMGMHSSAMGYSNAIDGSGKFIDAALSESPEFSAPDNIDIRFSSVCSAKAQKLIDKVWTRLLQ